MEKKIEIINKEKTKKDKILNFLKFKFNFFKLNTINIKDNRK